MIEGFLRFMGIAALKCLVKGLHDFLHENPGSAGGMPVEPSDAEFVTVLLDWP